MTIEQIAEVCHEANRAYCGTLGDFSLDPWGLSPGWQRLSVLNGVKFKIENPSVTPAGMHENWMREKREQGWTYGEVKDPEAKTHPCFLPYGELPAEQRAKDYIFTAIVHALAAFVE